MKRATGWGAVLLVLTLLGWYSRDRFCQSYPEEAICAPAPEPTLTPPPIPEPTPTPTPPPDICAGVVCPAKEHCEGGVCVDDPPPPPPATWCPKPLAAGATLKLRVKRYGNGVDSTVYVVGDPAFCEAIHGQPNLPQCHLEGWQTRQACEIELMGGCQTWRYRSGTEGGVCHDDRVDAAVSCDHFGSAGAAHDDPNTPTTGDTLATLQGFEGTPPACGLQRDAYGPNAGPWTMPQCTGGRSCEVAACLPDGTGCSPYLTVDWR